MDGSVGGSTDRRLSRLGALAGYLALALGVTLATWPIATDLTRIWPDHHDPRLFTWVMASVARRLLTAPLSLYHGNALYPYGLSLAYSETLLVPALIGLPGFVWGNPVLTYNLLVLTLWPLNGLAMAWVAVRLTGSRPAAWLAAAIFCLSPYFTEYHVEFQMLLAAPIPLMLYAWVRWLEDGRARHLAAVGAGLVLLGATTWYYAIVTSFGLSALAAGVLALCWRGWKWRRRIPALALAGLAVGAALAPFALPYLTVNRELQLTRTLDETAAHSANLVAWVTPAPRGWLVGFFPRHYFNAETWPFVGFTALALAAVSLVWLRRDLASRAARSLRRAGLVVVVLALGLLALSGAMLASGGHLTLGPVTVRPGDARAAGDRGSRRRRLAPAARVGQAPGGRGAGALRGRLGPPLAAPDRCLGAALAGPRDAPGRLGPGRGAVRRAV